MVLMHTFECVKCECITSVYVFKSILAHPSKEKQLNDDILVQTYTDYRIVDETRCKMAKQIRILRPRLYSDLILLFLIINYILFSQICSFFWLHYQLRQTFFL